MKSSQMKRKGAFIINREKKASVSMKLVMGIREAASNSMT